MREHLMKIVYWQPEREDEYEDEEDDANLTRSERRRQRRRQYGPSDEDVIEAAKNLVLLDLALLKAEMECGMYIKPIEEIAKTYAYEPVPSEVRAVIIAAWQRRGLLPPAVP
jgi:hypothetical protein